MLSWGVTHRNRAGQRSAAQPHLSSPTPVDARVEYLAPPASILKCTSLCSVVHPGTELAGSPGKSTTRQRHSNRHQTCRRHQLLPSYYNNLALNASADDQQKRTAAGRASRGRSRQLL